MILFRDIYNKAINLFDDPDISKAYVQDTIRFEKMMYPHLQEGLPLFNNPTRVSWLLTDQTDPNGFVETKIVTVASQDFILETTPTDNAIFKCCVNGVEDVGATYNKTNNKIIFSKTIQVNDELFVEWYDCGHFNANFSNVVTSAGITAEFIEVKVKDILARALVIAWAEKERDFALEIRNILTDTDFRIYSPANSIRSKVEWVKNLKNEFSTLTTKLCWDLNSRQFHGGRFYG